MKRTKIVCTIGPSSEDKKVLTQMIKSGMNVARLNFSHGSYAHHKMLIQNIRSVAKKLGVPIAIMQDLQGPRIRVSEVHKSGLEVFKDEEVVLVPDEMINYKLIIKKKQKIVPIQYTELYKFLSPEKKILINDGLIALNVVAVKEKFIYCRVLKPGIIFSHRGINLPGIEISSEVITAKDKEDLKFGLTQDVDWVALSFVRHGEDIADIKKLIAKYSRKKNPQFFPKVIAKIERREAVNCFSKILEMADGIMIARGDLGIEIPAADVPIIQKKIIYQCLQVAKPVIVATQMLESMMINPRPTRAEVSDVANAVIDHTDAVMLSGETATGNYPVETVKMMKDIIVTAEQSPYDDLRLGDIHYLGEELSMAVVSQAIDLARYSPAKAILAVTRTGAIARMLSCYRPEKTIIVMTDNQKTYRQLVLSWGIWPVLAKKISRNLNTLIKRLLNIARQEKIVKKGDKVIIVTSDPVGKKEDMNLIEMRQV